MSYGQRFTCKNDEVIAFLTIGSLKDTWSNLKVVEPQEAGNSHSKFLCCSWIWDHVYFVSMHQQYSVEGGNKYPNIPSTARGLNIMFLDSKTASWKCVYGSQLTSPFCRQDQWYCIQKSTLWIVLADFPRLTLGRGYGLITIREGDTT